MEERRLLENDRPVQHLHISGGGCKACMRVSFPDSLLFFAVSGGRRKPVCSLITSKKRSMVTKMSFDIYACNHDLDTRRVCRELDPLTYYGMNLLDYLTGNTDRHPENWGFLIDNETNEPISLYPVMDFNQSFLAYDTLDGANCQTVLPEKKTQRQAAIEAVRQIGLPQIREMDLGRFGKRKQEAEMYRLRLAELKRYAKKGSRE